MSVAERGPAVARTVSPPVPARRQSPSPAKAVVVIAPLALTIALGLWGIRRQNTMWGDESVTYQLAHRDLSQIWLTAQHIDLVHALYYAVMHEIFGLFGGGLLTLRLPSVLAMSLAAAGVGLLGLRLAGPRAGLLAGLVFPLLPQVQKFAQEGRSYAMVCALVTWATYALVVSVQHRARWRWAVYGSTMLLACLLHEFAVLALVAHGVTLVVSRVPRPVLRAWSVAAAGVVAGLLPLAICSAGQSEQVSWIGGPVRLQYFLVVAVVGVVCARAPLGVRGPVRLAVLAVPILVLPGLLLLIASLVKPLFVDRYVVYSNIGIALLLGALMDYFHRRQPSSRITWIAAVAVLAALVPPSLSLRTPQSRSDNVTAIGAAVRKEGRPGDGLLYLAGRHRILTAANPEDTRFLTDLALAQDPVSSNTLAGVELPAQEIAARMLEFNRIVAVRAAGAPPPANPQEEAKTSTLRRHFREYGTTHVNGARVTVYVRDHDPSPKAGPGSNSPGASGGVMR
ncbi:glycosyltransferase family 39 protein [Streptomyces europaeiscabiei]|uniref:glycosyltransferase family 39 protein n=1 Tax=Streptomyces europaeiscabiei TaxID=146819 RepID=UPI0029A9AA71|nr:glycosyltransferase family 39 protein [Streptomyces europaeiscabiei]MDX2769146.1 glycosyltransferase family 39 protein [Streptomyces europaeiscabiei]MDX3715810.1 glycosyltransferase family 39 protein [Streptomyces europaeiscabiei]